MSGNLMAEQSHHSPAWTIWAVSLALLLIGLLTHMLSAVTVRLPLPSVSDVTLGLLACSIQIVVATLGALIISRQAKNPIGWIFLAVGLLVSLNIDVDAYATFGASSLRGAAVAAWLGNLTQGPLVFGIFVFVFLLFPNGRLLSFHWRWVAWAAATALIVVTLSAAVIPGPLQSYPAVRNPFGIVALDALLQAAMSLAFFAVLLTLGAAAASLVLRFRRSRGDERQQLKWIAGATVLAAIMLLSGPLFWFVLPPRVAWLWPVVFFLAVIIIAISIGVAMLKYRLYAIDLIINRALVYGALTACIAGLYILVVGYLGSVLRTGDNLGISLLATGLVAVLFQPLRERLQRGVNRLMFGERDEPYAVIGRLGQRLETAISPEALLPIVAETVAQALKLPYVAIALQEGDGYAIAAAAGTAVGELLSLPLVYQQESIGRLVLAPRAPGESLSPADVRLLADLARQASSAAHAVRLTADLQRSRERLVTAREEERRRLRRDLHDGLGPSLAAQTLKVGSARALYPHDPAAADALLVALEGDIDGALAEVRRLVYNLRPPALDELGLVGAIRASAAAYRKQPEHGNGGLRIAVDAPDDLPPLPAAIEVAAYRIIQEALTNVARHAHARRCGIGLQVLPEGECPLLAVTIVDDGVGLAAERKAGVGLPSMRERAAELGGVLAVETPPEGGTRVWARLPLRPLGAVSAPIVGREQADARTPWAETNVATVKKAARWS